MRTTFTVSAACRVGTPTMLLALVLASGEVQGQGAAPQRRHALVESFDTRVAVAPTVVRVADRPHLVHELHLTNVRATDVRLRRLRVVAATDSGDVLADLSGESLTQALLPLARGAGRVRDGMLPSGAQVVYHGWTALAPGRAIPAAIRHVLDFDTSSTGPAEATSRAHAQLRTPAAALSTLAPVVLDPPLRGGDWAALYDPSMAGGHRTTFYTLDGRSRIPGRFAMDFVGLPPAGTFDAKARGVSRNGYGAEVLAVASGVVLAAVDDMPDNEDVPDAPPRRFPLERASGNYIALALPGGHVAFYEHLRAGSIRVRAGDSVRAGAVIATLGYSGSSSIGPHLHFHVSDTASLLGAEGAPFVFRSYREAGAFRNIGDFVAGARWSGSERERTEAMPSPNSVVRFR